MAIQDDTIVTLAEMRAYLNITDASDTSMDSELEDLLDSYNDLIAEYLGLDNMLTTTYTDEKHDGDGIPYIYTDHKPIVTVTSLTEDDISLGTENTDYYVYGKAGYIRLDGDTFDNDELQNIKITYTAGYGAARANVPRPLKLALKKWVAAVYRGDVVDISSRFEQGAYQNTSVTGMPKAVEEILYRYRPIMLGSI